MAKSAKIDDITKLNPALLEISSAEIDRRITELLMAKEHKAAEAERLDREAKLDEAGAKIDAVLDGLKWLEANGFLSEKVKGYFTTTSGMFAPHLAMKKPR